VIQKWTGAFMTSSKSRSRALAFAVVVAWSLACGDETRPVEVDSAPPLEEIVACELSNSEQGQGLCEVGRVVDGDTLVIDLFGSEVKVRLAEIDAPESRQEYGSEATALLESLVRGKEIELIEVDRDRYGRVVAHLHSEQGCVNQRLVEQGAAWHYEDYSDSAAMAAFQTGAKSARLGLWGRDEIVAPWDFRRGGSGSKTAGTQERELSEVVSWTGSGRKYHKESCRYLSKAKVVNTGASPPSALTPCSVCFGRGE
jgi:micrococcal nuclease